MTTQQTKAYACAAAAIVFWATVPTAFKLSLAQMDATVLVFYASATSLLALSAVLFISGAFQDLSAWTARDVLRSIVLGFLNPFAYYQVLLRAYDLLPAQEAQPLNMIWPLVLVVFSVFMLGQKLRGLTLLAMLISFSGVLVIATRGNLFDFQVSDPLGVSLAMGSAVIWALYWTAGINDPRDPIARMFVNFAFGCSYMALFLLARGGIPWPGNSAIGAALYVGCFEMGFTFVLWLNALRLSETTAQVSNLVFLTPFLSLFFVHLVLGEAILPSTIVGLVFIVAGIALQRTDERRIRD